MLADFDRDGHLDLLVTAIAGSTRFFLGDGALGFEDMSVTAGLDADVSRPQMGVGAAVGDVDRDGWLDVLITHWGPSFGGCGDTRTRLFRNRGAGAQPRFEDVTEAKIPSLLGGQRGGFFFGGAFPDIDRDGWPDALVTGDFGLTRFYWGASGEFLDATEATAVGAGIDGMGSTVADFDGDGELDIFMTGTWNESIQTSRHGLYLYRGARTFETRVVAEGAPDGGWGWGTAAFDADHDGDPDLVAAAGLPPLSGAGDKPLYWENDGSARFVDRAASVGFVSDTPTDSLVLIDYDGDGDEDVLLIRLGTPLLYRNDGGVARGEWLQVRARGRASNPDGIGARVEVTVDGRTQVHEIGTPTHYTGYSIPRAHFGFGPRPGLDRTADVRVRFLGGNVVLRQGVSLNTRIVVVEPDAMPPDARGSIPTPADCDRDRSPDICAQDCDENGRPDRCDLDEGAGDCNDNGTLDSCELAAGFLSDCDSNGAADLCEMEDDPTLDCDRDGTLDRCELLPPRCDPTDGGTSRDLGPPHDASTVPDAEVPRDAGARDQGPTMDASGPEGGATPPNLGVSVGGSTCSARRTTTFSGSTPWAFALVALFSSWWRRRRSRPAPRAR